MLRVVRNLESFNVTGNGNSRYSTYEFLFAFHTNYVPMLHRF